ncbi:hypothetical protein BBG47_20000 [Paenibacillus sp. KS1]|uniref:hypothetical protein n=1 Tax=Paenibacillus sp. KS1 TaxID=1849249 RepID=UPI00080669DE|nr:hypothetical protein [Paenibacillus sp. KS1]OBY77775.1 hypothetical protein BBG47_20000 [Paenibacillus sp. KS1]
MDNEVSNSIHVMITLIVVAVIVGMISLFWAMSQGFSREAVTSVAEIQAETFATELINTAQHGPIPAASAFVMLEKNANAVKSLSGNAYGINVTKIEDLASMFSKKIRLTVIGADKKLDAYDVIVKEE